MYPRLAAAVFVAALQLTAQTQPGQQARGRLAEIRDTLNLTPEQMEKVLPIILEELKAMRDVRDGDGRPMQKMREANQIQNKADKQLKEFLDEDQQKAFKKLWEQWRKQNREKAPPPQ